MSKYCNSADKVKMLEPSQHFNPGFIIASKSIFWSQGSHLGQIWSQWVTFVNVNYQLLTWEDKKWQGKTAGKCPRYVGAENATFPLLFENISLLLQMWENNHCSITSRSARVALVRLACNEVGLNNYWYTFHSGWSQSERRWWIWVAGGAIPPCRKCWVQDTKKMLPHLVRKCFSLANDLGLWTLTLPTPSSWSYLKHKKKKPSKNNTSRHKEFAFCPPFLQLGLWGLKC